MDELKDFFSAVVGCVSAGHEEGLVCVGGEGDERDGET